jgi:hypothetical protein
MNRSPIACFTQEPFRVPARSRMCLVLIVSCLVASGGPLARAASAGGDCPANGLASGVSDFVTDDPATFQVNSPEARWAAVAMRNQDGNDWNLEVRSESEPPPVCTSGTIVVSNAFGHDVLAIDGRVGSPGSDFVLAQTGNGSGFFARIEYEQPAGAMQANGVFQVVSTGPDDFLAVREIQMSAGVPYSIRIQPSSDLGSMRVYVFAPTSSGPGWLARNEAGLEATLAPDLLNWIDYTPAETGPHALVIVNESGAAGTYQLAVGHCPFFASILTEGLPWYFATLDQWPGFTPNANSWPVVGVRGDGHLYNLDVAPYPRSQFGTFPTCSDSIVGTQYSGLGVRLVTADFQTLPLRTYTVHTSAEGQPQTSSAGHIEWDGAGDAITVNDPPISVVPPPNNVLDAWKIALTAGITYTFQLVPELGSTADYRLLVFGNPSPGNPYWASRPDAILEATGPHGFIPGQSGLYGVVVVNDNGGTGNYSLSVTADLVDVPTGPPAVAAHRIRAAAPNPSAGAMRIEFELARPGTAEFRLRDVAGRTVAILPAGRRDAGIASFTLDGTGAGGGGVAGSRDGRRVAAGVYFLSLVVDGVEAHGVRVVLLR